MRVIIADPGPQVPAYGRALAEALAAAGDRVTLATAPLLYFDPGPPPDGVTVERPFGRLLRWSTAGGLLARHAAARRLLRAAGYPFELAAWAFRARRARPDVVHVQWSLAPLLDALALRWLRRSGIVTVLTAHNVLPHERQPWHAATYRRLYAAADLVIVHSAATRARLRALGWTPPRRVEVISMAADAPNAAPSRAAAREALGLPEGASVTLFFGHVRPYKGLDVLLAAWRPVGLALREARLVIAGPVAGGERRVRDIRAAIDRLGLAGSVDLRPGHVPADEVTAYFAAADVVALPYRETDDSAVLATARGHGRAVVATAVGGLPEALEGGGGWVVPPEDPQALAVALAAILRDAALRSRLEAKARKAAAAWSWRDVAAATRRAYRVAARRARDPTAARDRDVAGDDEVAGDGR